VLRSVPQARGALRGPARSARADRATRGIHDIRMSSAPRAVVVGAGVFGSWTAEHLRRAGWHVLLVDRMGPANALASSGGESRLTRANYGPDEIYTRMALRSLAEWKRLSDASRLPLFHPHGVLFFFDELVDYARACIDVHERLALPLEVLNRAALAARWPQIDFTG